jgi:hypothetical protein
MRFNGLFLSRLRSGRHFDEIQDVTFTIVLIAIGVTGQTVRRSYACGGIGNSITTLTFPTFAMLAVLFGHIMTTPTKTSENTIVVTINVAL